MPHEWEDAGIECQLINYQLRDSSEGANLYEALSYVWGDKSTRRSISINKCDVQVTANLYAALLHLRDRVFERVLWVDAICINQQDADEKGRQVNSMANIYAKAGRVLVWLGEAAEDSDQAIEDIRAAGLQERYEPLHDKKRQDAIFSLLRRTWFERVLQEVAAARQVLIKCGSAEMDGHAFCLGLSTLKLPYELCLGLQSIIYTATYLIRGALFRPRRGASQSGPSFLQIRPLGELVEMYHTRKATEHHDKVYALLGMASDGNADKKLLADYNISWKELFKRLIHSILPKQHHSVATWSDREVAIIRGKGYLLGEISLVEKDSTWEDKQKVHITWRNEPSGHGVRHEKTSPRLIQSGAKAIQAGDLVCLLQDAAKPTILRLLDDHMTIIRIAVHFDGEEFDGNGTRPKTSLLDVPLVWDWENRPEAREYDKLFVSSQVPEPSELDEHLEKTARLESIRLVFQTTMRYDALAENLRTTTEVFERAFKTLDKLAVPWFIHRDKPKQGHVSKILAMVDQFIRHIGRWETICIAAIGGHKSVIKLLLDTGMVDLDDQKYLSLPFWLAIQHKHEEASKLLLSAGGANWNMEITDKQTALFQAAKNGNGTVTKLLLDSGKVDPDAKNMDGWRPLQLAAESG
ncbi:heterokaryon incompatibility protein-domain-containing protein, partial [Lasiosphaeris hirsuta]